MLTTYSCLLELLSRVFHRCSLQHLKLSRHFEHRTGARHMINYDVTKHGGLLLRNDICHSVYKFCVSYLSCFRNFIE